MRDWTFVDAYDSVWGSGESGGEAELVTASIRRSGEPEGQDGDAVEMFGHACIAYRPADPDKGGVCQMLVGTMGGQAYAFATRDLRLSAVAPALGKGDMAIGAPTGKTTFISKADGSAAIFKKGETADAGISIEKDDRILMFNQWGTISLGPQGFMVSLATGQLFHLAPSGCQVMAPTFAAKCGNIALGVAASRPLAAAPITGTVGAGFCPTSPVLHIFV